MLPDALVVADASPIIGLGRAGHLHLLPAVFATVTAPPAVVAEVGQRPAWLRSVEVEHPAEAELLRALSFGRGESEVLAVALRRPGAVALLDEKRARGFASARGVAVVGTVGVVLRARQRGVIAAVRPVLDDLIGSGFRLSESLYRAALSRAGEA